MTLQVLFANNTAATLLNPLTSSATTVTLNSGQGAQFPNPVSGVQFFPLTLQSASNSTLYEITYCTARSGDTLTIERAQEGTTALAFNAGDLAQNRPTAATLQYSGRLLNIQRFTTAGTATYTSTIGTQSVVFGVQGGGGGSAGVGAAGTGNAIAGEPGNGGAYGEARVTSGFSGITITVGAGGAAGVPNVSNGGSGGASSAGAFVNSPGGPGGQQGNVDAGSASGGNGLTSGLPTFSGGAQIIKACQGGVGSISLGFTTGSVSYGGSGGNAGDGGGGAQGVSANFNGIAAESPGSGASGTMGINNSGVLNGALGADGYVLVFEFS